MSYDLAVWEGDRPADDAAAREEYFRLYEQYVASPARPLPTSHSDFQNLTRRDRQPPTPRIAAYVRALLDQYPDITGNDGEDSPWADGPLINDASGPFFYFAMVWSKCEGASAWAAQVAHDHGLVCYDPQIGQLRP
jgi:hypothetical protein